MQGDAAPPVVMTYDFGTTSLKAVLVDGSGRIVSQASESYPLIQLQAGWAEQDPHRLWQAAAHAGGRALAASGLSSNSVGAVVFVAPWKGVIPVREDGEVLAHAMIWMDSRATEEAEELNGRLGEFVGTGQEYWPRLMWLKRRQPEIWRASRWIMGVTTYLKWMATGAVATEPSDDFIRSERPAQQARYGRILAAAGLVEDANKFPPSTAAGDKVGELSAAAAAHLGLPAAIPVYGGFGDLPAITAGAGPLVAGATHIYLGTSSWLLCVVEPESPLKSALRVTLDRRYDGALYCLQSACLAFDWIVAQVYSHEKATLGDGFLDFVNREVAEVPAGSGDLIATHWLTGELPPLSKNVKGVYLNLTPRHDRRHMVRAMMESVCYSLRSSLEWFERESGRRLDDITVVGGGACSAIWMQALADVLGRTIVVPDAPRSVGAIGAFRCTLGAEPSPSRSAVAEGVRFRPDARAQAVYNRLYRLYGQIHPALLDLSERLNGPRSDPDGSTT